MAQPDLESYWARLAYDRHDLSNCASEPLQFCGAIQAGGYFMVCNAETARVEVASANCGDLIKVSTAEPPAANEVFGRDIFDILILDGPQEATIARALERSSAGAVLVRAKLTGQHYHASFYKGDHGICVDIEPLVTSDDGASVRYVDELRKLVNQVDSVGDLDQMLARGANQVREITGFNRVMIYRFEPNWDGVVVAESRDAEFESWLGLCYPHTDIPAQARRLYMESPFRMIISTQTQPVPIVTRPGRGRSEINLSCSALRAVSPLHIEYLNNMGVHASFSVPIRVAGRLWGLIACHHYSHDIHLPREIRSSCELAAQVLSGRIADFISDRRLRLRNHVYEFSQNLLSLVSEGKAAVQAFASAGPELLDLTQSTGAFVRLGGGEMCIGTTPDPAVIQKILDGLKQRPGLALWSSRSLKNDLPGIDAADPKGVGALAVPLSFGFEDLFIWFRPEAVEEVRWGGKPDPEKADKLLSPRASFKAWTEVIRGKSRQWTEADLEAAQHLLFTFVKGIFKKAAELSKANSELEVVTRAKDEFIGMVSHELRTPLGVMIGWIDILKDEGLKDPRLTQAIDIIDRNARLQINLINDLLDISRIISGKMRLTPEPNVEISAILREVVTSLQPTAHTKNVTIETELAERTFVSADPERLRQVVWNLLSNAIKFTPKGGRIRASVQREASSYRIEVSDNGIGIAPDQLKRIFNRFSQAQEHHAQIGGLGLGLSIVKALVELHGGDVRAESGGLGQGSSFIATLPIFAMKHEDPVAIAPTASPDAATPALKDIRILVAEDQPEAALALKHVLEKMGAKVTLTSGGREALAKLKAGPFDLILSDIGMPDGDGFELIRAWRALERERQAQPIPALALTAYATSRDRTRCLDAGFQNHIPKPVDRQELMAVIRSLGLKVEA